MVKRGRWQGQSLFCTRVLDLSENYLKTINPASSDTFAPRALLDHFFGQLKNPGLRDMGSPGVGMYDKTQYVQQIWSSPGGELHIVGQVVFDSDSARAVVSCIVIEAYE